MAFDFSKLNFFKKLDARSRIFFLFAGLVGIVLIIYLSSRFLSSGDTTGASQVASAPVGPSIQGGQLTAEYATALKQANEQASAAAQITGKSAVYTMVNTNDQLQSGGCVICSDQSANVKNNLDQWVKEGSVTPEVAAALEQLADKNVPESEYADYLNQLVKDGKLTPEQARLLLEQYKKQHANNLLDESAKTMDGLIKSGQLPLASANQLLLAQKRAASSSDYANELQELVKQGKISPAVAQQLLAQYTQQRTKTIIQQSIASLRQLHRSGQLMADVEKVLIDLENRVVPVDTYSATLQKFVAEGKLVPAVADKILAEFKMQKASIGPIGAVNDLLQKAEAAAYGELDDLLKANKISEDTANVLRDMIKKNIPFEDYQNAVNQLVQQGKLTPEISKLKIADYRAVKGLRDMEQNLSNLQGNNATPSTYADALKRGVQAGLLTPEQAAQLMQEYEAISARTRTATPTGDDEFAKLKERVQQGSNVAGSGVNSQEFTDAKIQAQQESDQERQERINALIGLMSTQAKDLINAWQPAAMLHREGSPEARAGDKATASTVLSAEQQKALADKAGNNQAGAALIKAGSVIFAVLDTAINSDYPDSPVMATVVDGTYKGAKLLGKLVTTKGVSGQMDRVSINFTIMNTDDWPKSKTVTAYAIDPDTARTVLASDVDYHYLQKYGAIMATSFVQGYANAIASSSSTTTTGIFGTSTTHPALSPGQKLATAIGQIGQSLGSVTQNYTNIPPTVRVDSGVSLGILFMSDVT